MFTLLSRWTLLFRTLPIRLALILFLCLLTVSASATVSAQQSDRTVTGLTLSSDGPGELGIRWNAATPEPVDYRVSWARSEDEYLTWTDDRGNAFPTANTLTVTDLDEGVEYKVRVRARYGGDGSGPWSEEVRLRVAGEDGASGGEPPLAPAGLRVSMTAHDRVVLAWDDPGDSSITGYQVLRRSRDGEEYGDGKGAPEFVSIVDDTGSAATTYSDGAVASGKRYVYRIRARNEHGLSPRSSYANAETPAEVAEPRLLVEGEMTVGFETDENRDESIYGYTVYGSSGRVGELSDDDFQLDGRRVTLGALGYLDAEPRDLYLGLNHWVEHPFVLQIGERRLSSRHGLRVEGGPPTVRWTEQCVEWSEGDVVPYGLRLVATDDPAYTQAVDDASLGSLSLAGTELRPAFGPEELEYRARVGWEVEAVSVSARANAGGACGVSVSPQPDGEGRVALAEGENPVRVEVTAGDGTTRRTYTIVVVRELGPYKDGAGLSGLSVSGASELDFTPRQTRYQVGVEPTVEEATVSPAGSAGDTATAVSAVRADGLLALDGADADPEAEGHQVRLSERGDTLALVRVRSGDGNRARLYTVRLRPSVEGEAGLPGVRWQGGGKTASPLWTVRSQDAASPRLTSLSLDGVSLSPAFAADTFEYTASVGQDVERVTVAAEPPTGGSVLVTPGDADGDTDGYQVALKAGEPGGDPVDTLIIVVVRSADGLGLESYVVRVTRAAPPSEDARLSELSLDGLELTPAFDPATLAYRATVSSDVAQVTISAMPSDGDATTVITPADANADAADGYQVALSEGDNVITLTVTAEDGTTTLVYTITVQRLPPPSSDARLQSLGLDAGQLQPEFDPDVQQYTAALDWAVNRVTLALTPAEVAAVVRVAPDDADPDSADYQLDLPAAKANGAALSTPVAIVVTAPDGVARRTYLLTLERAARPSDDASLASLSVAGLELMPAFNSETLSYEATAGEDATQITLSAAATQPDADISIDPPAAAAAEGYQIQLLSRLTSVSITVTAPDGVTTHVYELSITSSGLLDTEITQALPRHCTLRELGPGESTPDVKFDRRCRSLFIPWSSRGTMYFRLLLREEGEVRLGVDAGFSTHLVLRSAAGDVLASALRPSGLSQAALYRPTINRTLAAGAYLVELIASGLPSDRSIRFWARGSNIVRPMAYRLEALSISDVNLNSFDIETFTYIRNVAGDVAFVTVTPTPTLSGAIVQITPADADPSTDAHEVSITDQQTSIQIHVSTPEAPQLVQSYEVSLNRLDAATSPLSNDTTLSALAFDSLDIGSFSPDVSRYSYTIGYYGALDGFTTTVLPSPTSPTATWTINHPDANPDQGGYQLRLDGGTPVVITVHSEDGASQRAYTVAAKSDYHSDPETNFHLAFPVAAPHITWTDGDIILGKSYYGSEFFVFEFSSGRLLERFEAGGPLDQWRFGTVFALWSHGGVVWALDYYRDKLTAFEYESRTLQPWRDISVPEVTRYGAAVWSDGVTAYVIDKGEELVPVLLSYDLRTRRHVRSVELTEHRGRGVLGMWSDGEVMWINGGYDVRAFELSSGRRIPGLDFTPNNPSRQLWSDGRTFWVLNGATSTMQAYTMPEHAKLKRLSFSSGSMGLFNGGIFEYDLQVPVGETTITVAAEAAFRGGASAVEMSIPDVDGDASNGHQIALAAGEEKVLTIRVTAPDGNNVEVYTVRLRHAD